jgi:antitoxin (DNA-binding transcriptional repressor) of toxin-antitoxin stability system
VKTVTIHVAKTTLSRLIAEVESGADIVIARGKTPVARLVPARAGRPQRRFGAMAGLARVTESFFEPLPEDELQRWE